MWMPRAGMLAHVNAVRVDGPLCGRPQQGSTSPVTGLVWFGWKGSTGPHRLSNGLLRWGLRCVLMEGWPRSRRLPVWWRISGSKDSRPGQHHWTGGKACSRTRAQAL